MDEVNRHLSATRKGVTGDDMGGVRQLALPSQQHHHKKKKTTGGDVELPKENQMDEMQADPEPEDMQMDDGKDTGVDLDDIDIDEDDAQSLAETGTSMKNVRNGYHSPFTDPTKSSISRRADDLCNAEFELNLFDAHTFQPRAHWDCTDYAKEREVLADNGLSLADNM